jgi:hypothetical protein
MDCPEASGHPKPRRRARAFVLRLLSELRRKNCWTIAEQAGYATPDGMQHLLVGARWDADAVRDDVRGYVVEHLGSPDAVLVVDETGDLKKGWGGRQGAPLLRLGLGGHRPGQARLPLAADPPHQGTCVLPLLQPPSGPPPHPGQGRRNPVDNGNPVGVVGSWPAR